MHGVQNKESTSLARIVWVRDEASHRFALHSDTYTYARDLHTLVLKC